MTINIFIARHGEAENAFPDCDRKLTNTGINQAKMVSGFLQKLCPDFESFEKVIVSPYVRAQETAKYILDGINYKEIETESLLVPNADSDLLIGYLEPIIEENKNYLIVSHLPLVGLIVLGLTNKSVSFKPGTIVKLTRDNDGNYFISQTYTPNP